MKLLLFGYICLFFLLGMVSGEDTSRADALLALNASRITIEELNASGFSTAHLEDLFLEGRRAFAQAEYATILRKEQNASAQEYQVAQQALQLVKWKNITYADVLRFTSEITMRTEQAYLLADKFTVERMSLSELNETTQQLFFEAERAFREERYNDTEYLLEQYTFAAEEGSIASITLGGLRKGAQTFIQQHTFEIIIGGIVFIFGAFLLYRRYEKRILRTHIENMKVELTVLATLMKRTQEERFNQNIISGIVYTIRMNRYKARMQEIKEKLPSLEKRLVSLSKRHNV